MLYEVITRSLSNEFPFTTNVGTARNSSVAHSGASAKRQASDSIATAATSENTM